ncbi:hypothetical protein SGPA1_30544 [Streptomyces misionensis JCM 4497]
MRWWSKERRPTSCGEMQVQGLPGAPDEPHPAVCGVGLFACADPAVCPCAVVAVVHTGQTRTRQGAHRDLVAHPHRRGTRAPHPGRTQAGPGRPARRAARARRPALGRLSHGHRLPRHHLHRPGLGAGAGHRVLGPRHGLQPRRRRQHGQRPGPPRAAHLPRRGLRGRPLRGVLLGRARPGRGHRSHPVAHGARLALAGDGLHGVRGRADHGLARARAAAGGAGPRLPAARPRRRRLAHPGTAGAVDRAGRTGGHPDLRRRRLGRDRRVGPRRAARPGALRGVPAQRGGGQAVHGRRLPAARGARADRVRAGGRGDPGVRGGVRGGPAHRGGGGGAGHRGGGAGPHGRGRRVRRRVRDRVPGGVAAGGPAGVRGADGGAVGAGVRGVAVGAGVVGDRGVVAAGPVRGGAGPGGAAPVRVPRPAGAGGTGPALAAAAGGAHDRVPPLRLTGRGPAGPEGTRQKSPTGLSAVRRTLEKTRPPCVVAAVIRRKRRPSAPAHDTDTHSSHPRAGAGESTVHRPRPAPHGDRAGFR